MLAEESRTSYNEEEQLPAESRLNYADLSGDGGINYNMYGYRNLAAAADGGIGQNRLNGFGQRAGLATSGVGGGGAVGGGGGVVGGGGGGLNQAAAGQYLDYADYGGGGVASAGLANRRYGGGGMMTRSSGYGSGGRGYGHQNVNFLSEAYGMCEDEGLNPALVLATLAGAAVAFLVLFNQVGGFGRKKRSALKYSAGLPSASELIEYLSSAAYVGK